MTRTANIHYADTQQAKSCGLHFSYRIIDPAAPLVYLVHGKDGNRRVMLLFEKLLPAGFNMLSPEAAIPDQRGYSWWLKSTAGEYQQAISGFYSFSRAAEKEFALTPACRIALGFSQGGALLSLVSQHHQRYFNGIALLASFYINQLTPDLNCRFFFAHGTNDEVILLEKTKSAADKLAATGAIVEFVSDQCGHKIGTSGMRALKNWLSNFSA